MVERNMGVLKGILASARYVDPNDQSPEARAKLTAEWRDFDGLRFLAEIGIEKGKDGFEDKNVIARARSRATCHSGAAVRQSTRSRKQCKLTMSAGGPAPIEKPNWAG